MKEIAHISTSPLRSLFWYPELKMLYMFYVHLLMLNFMNQNVYKQ